MSNTRFLGTEGNRAPSCFPYWGKARPITQAEERYHLLPFHSLDVAVCGEALLDLPSLSLQPLAAILFI
jgi:CRISPR-associated endonuclease/helicase Cas3